MNDMIADRRLEILIEDRELKSNTNGHSKNTNSGAAQLVYKEGAAY